MTNKIQEITEKIYNEGIVKANEEADALLNEAKNQAQNIIEEAKTKASKLVEEAEKSALEEKTKLHSELKMAALQFTSNLKQRITQSITLAQTESSLHTAFDDTEFVKKIILAIVEKWNPEKPEELDLKILLPEKDKTEFSSFLKEKTINQLNGKIAIEFDSKTKKGFKIGPENGNYVISFEEKDFENFFRKYFRESTKKMLFDA